MSYPEGVISTTLASGSKKVKTKPMTRQINFFADRLDQSKMHSFLLRSIVPLYVINGDRGKPDELVPTLVTDGGMLTHFRKAFLLPEPELASIVYHDLSEVVPNQVIVDENATPVLVYNPCVLESDRSL